MVRSSERSLYLNRWVRIAGLMALYGGGVLGISLVPLWFGWPRPPKSREIMAQEIKRAMAAGAEDVRLPVGKTVFLLVRIPPGEFEMGSWPTGVARRVCISKPFYPGRFEVTQFQYREVIGPTGKFRFQGDSLPVQDMWYCDVLEFCQKLSERTGLLITLPTEAQWEYACRAGTKSRYYSGDTEADLDRIGWYEGNAGKTSHAVGQKQPNAWGLYDMHGNVWEPCIDCLHSFDSHRPLEDTDPRGYMGLRRSAMRGGGWMHPADYSCAARSLITDDKFGGMGIRIAINADAWEE